MRNFKISPVIGILFLFNNIHISSADTLQKDPSHVYICTFNVYKLGSVDEKYSSRGNPEDDDTGNRDIPERIKNLANVLSVGKFDLIVLQEVTDGYKGEWAVSDLVSELAEEHNLHYEKFLSGYIGRGLIKEAMAFIYNPDVIEPSIPTGHITLAVNIEIDGRDLVRTQWRAGDFDFTLVAAHLAWGNEAHRDRGYEVSRSILTMATPSQFSFDPDIILLGDFNRFGKGYDSVKKLRYGPGDFNVPNVAVFDPDIQEIKEVTKSSIEGRGIPFDSVQLISTTVAKNRFAYDMVLFTNDALEEFREDVDNAEYGVDYGIIHFDEEYGFGFQSGTDSLAHYNLKIAYSDHRPLWIRFRMDAGHFDSTVSGPERPATLTEYLGTERGRYFHLSGCRSIKNRDTPKRWNSREVALSERGPCGICKP